MMVSVLILIFFIKYLYVLVGPYKVIQESLGSWIPHYALRIPSPWIPDSTVQKWLDSGFHKLEFGFHRLKFAEFRITLHGPILG